MAAKQRRTPVDEKRGACESYGQQQRVGAARGSGQADPGVMTQVLGYREGG